MILPHKFRQRLFYLGLPMVIQIQPRSQLAGEKDHSTPTLHWSNCYAFPTYVTWTNFSVVTSPVVTPWPWCYCDMTYLILTHSWKEQPWCLLWTDYGASPAYSGEWSCDSPLFQKRCLTHLLLLYDLPDSALGRLAYASSCLTCFPFHLILH